MWRMSEARAAVGAGTKRGKPVEAVVVEDATRPAIGVIDFRFELGEARPSGPELSSPPTLVRGGVLGLSHADAPPPVPAMEDVDA